MNKKINLVRHLWVFIFYLLSYQTQALASFEEKIKTLIQQQLPHATVGLIIRDPQTGQVVFQRHAQENFYPASNTKLFTAAAALKFFGPEFYFQTSIHAPIEQIKAGTLEHSLYFIFRGDPSLKVKDISTLLQEVKAKGIHQIRGNLVIDDQSFSGPAYAPGWTWDSLPWYYSAPITSIILNENKVRLKLHKPAGVNQPIVIEQVDETVPTFKVTSTVKAVTLAESEHSCELQVKNLNNEIQLTGCWAWEKTPALLELALDDPRKLVKALIKEGLKKNNIQLSGDIVFGKAPLEIPALIIKPSPPLKELLVKVLRDSNNVYTESLTKALGLGLSTQGSFQAGTQAIKKVLTKETRLEFSQARLSDGSGQSRYNLISPALISQLLFAMYHDPQFSVFYQALSTSGENGTLASRFKETPASGRFVAKTGSAIGTSALSGYFTTVSGKNYVFSLLINQANHDYNALKAFEDKLCLWLLEEPWHTDLK